MPAQLVFAIAVAVGVVTVVALVWMLFDVIQQARRARGAVRPDHDAL